ncbi:hypothetical protein Tco_0685731 [Tanacetum coccineum]
MLGSSLSDPSLLIVPRCGRWLLVAMSLEKGDHSQMSRELTILPICSVGRMIGFENRPSWGENVPLGLLEGSLAWFYCPWKRMHHHRRGVFWLWLEIHFDAGARRLT